MNSQSEFEKLQTAPCRRIYLACLNYYLNGHLELNRRPSSHCTATLFCSSTQTPSVS